MNTARPTQTVTRFRRRLQRPFDRPRPGTACPRLALSAVAAALVVGSAFGQGRMRVLTDFREGSHSAYAEQVGTPEFDSYGGPGTGQGFGPIHFGSMLQSGDTMIAKALSIFVTKSEFEWVDEPLSHFDRFTLSQIATQSLTSTGPTAATTLHNSIAFTFMVEDVPPGQRMPVRFAVSHTNTGGTLLFRIQHGQTTVFERMPTETGAFDELVMLEPGQHTFLALNAGAVSTNDGFAGLVRTFEGAFEALPASTPLTRPVRNPDNGHRYTLVTPSLAVTQRALAESTGGHLVTIRDAVENDWLRQSKANLGGEPRWLRLGLADESGDGDFVWHSDAPIDFVNWADGAPGEADGIDAPHAVLDPETGLWHLENAGLHHAVIEHARAECGPSAPDIGDCFTASAQPGCSIASCCNLICTYAAFCCTIAWDEFCAEAAEEWCAPQFVSGPYQFDGVWHYVVSPAPVHEAQKLARSIGGTLATVHDQGKNDYVRQLAAFDGTPRRVWLALSDAAIEGQWWWKDGAPLTWSNWAPGQPDNGGVADPTSELGEHFVEMLPDGTWNDTFEFGSGTTPNWSIVEVARQCGLPLTGDCFEFGPIPYCEDRVCCEIVCELDPSCCQIFWSMACVELAQHMCDAGGFIVCPADLDDNGVVDGADLGLLLNAWGTAGPADLNGDGIVDGADLGLLLNAWGACD